MRLPLGSVLKAGLEWEAAQFVGFSENCPGLLRIPDYDALPVEISLPSIHEEKNLTPSTERLSPVLKVNGKVPNKPGEDNTHSRRLKIWIEIDPDPTVQKHRIRNRRRLLFNNREAAKKIVVRPLRP